MIAIERCFPGRPVFYEPSRGGQLYAGIVRTEPWQIGSGTWVCHLECMEPAYGDDTGRPGRTHVHAAVLDRLYPRHAE